MGGPGSGAKARFLAPNPSDNAPTLHGVSAESARDLDVIDLDSTDLIQKADVTLCPIVGGEPECASPGP